MTKNAMYATLAFVLLVYVTLVAWATFPSSLRQLGTIDSGGIKTDVWKADRCVIMITKFEGQPNPNYYFACEK